MDVYQIIVSLLEKPGVPKFYRELRKYYEGKGMTHEASAISHLIEKKFGKKDDTSADGPHDGAGQPGDGSVRT
jgi:hypothetical protein